jgi:hypothetical protein
MLHPKQKAEPQNSEHAFPDLALTILPSGEGGLNGFWALVAVSFTLQRAARIVGRSLRPELV